MGQFNWRNVGGLELGFGDVESVLWARTVFSCDCRGGEASDM